MTSMQNFRRLGDRFIWTIPLPTSNVEKLEQPDFVIEHSCLILDRNESPGLTTYTVSTNSFQHTSLKYRHVRPYCAIKWTHFLGQRPHSYAKLDLLAAKPGERPEWFGKDGIHGVENVNPNDFYNRYSLLGSKRSQHWRTFDDQFP